MSNFLDRFVGKKVKLILNSGYVKIGILESFDDISINIIFNNNIPESINRKSIDTIKLAKEGVY